MAEPRQLLQKSQNIFPTDGLTGRSAHTGVAINKGHHVFPFSITVWLSLLSLPRQHAFLRIYRLVSTGL